MKKNIAILFDGSLSTENYESSEFFLILDECKSHALPISFQAFAHSNSSSPSPQVIKKVKELTGQDFKSFSELRSTDFDGLIIPGSEELSVDSALEKAILNFHSESRPIFSSSQASVLIAQVLCDCQVNIALNEDHPLYDQLLSDGAEVIPCPSDDFVTDRLNKVISTTAFLNSDPISVVKKGLSGALSEFLEMA